ncbi:Bystin, putative isoform 1 [Theobroma cacao]|uniref:Bystin, putative isoform 1 n=1 Tax=Theobroma cacao TaxID=3641 RepID=A0A061GU04_THECC|nr:Bystin, putative isoform 1 [Theobroma cacao]EOY33321.1 Bystin, putative isoform 1 [Theobroma cacao]
MAKNKRERNQNPQPFLADDDSVASTKKRSKAAKHHQKQDKMISSGMSSKILKEALLQQREIDEEDSAGNFNGAFGSVEEERNKHEEEEDIDDFGGFSETQSQFGNYEEEIDEEDEKLLEAFLSKNAGPKRTLADLIIQKIKESDANVASETRPLPKLDDSLIDLYKGVGKFLNKYTAGKMPKVFKHIPSMQLWEDVLYLTEPENWSPNAMFQATRIFASNLGAKKAERFYRLVLLPRVRDDIRKNKCLHFALYQSLKKALYKAAAFNKGILLPLCKSGTCSLREAVIIGSVLTKVTIPRLHSSVALMKLAEMEYCGTTSYFIKLLLEKKYALPYRVVDAVVSHFMRFLEDTRIMPVIWHQSLLAFVQRYKNELRKEDKDNLRILVETQKHKSVTPEIIRELDNSRNRGEKEDDPMLMASPVSVINKAIEEDRFDIPDVPMEED